MSGSLFTGTSGYSYKEWRGAFYPQDLAPTGFLSHYATRLDTVEINNTFYRFPSEKVLAQWRDETPSLFRFAVKANQRITHRARLKNAGEVTASFIERCATLGDRLGPVLFQLPPQFARNDDRLRAFLAMLPEDGRYAMEFRHRSWFEDEVLEALTGAGVALVQSEDEKLSAPRVATAPFCYVRLRKDEYGPEALSDWRAWIEERLAEGRDVYVFLKHDESGISPEPILGALRSR